MSTTRVQTYRTDVPGERPPGLEPGTLFVNTADQQLGYADAAGDPVDLLAVPVFSEAAAYLLGDLVTQASDVWVALDDVPAGAFNAGAWRNLTAAPAAYQSEDAPDPAAIIPGNLWLDTGDTDHPVLKVWDGAVHQDASGDKLPLAGGDLTGNLTFLHADGGQRNVYFDASGQHRFRVRDDPDNFQLVPYDAMGTALFSNALKYTYESGQWTVGDDHFRSTSPMTYYIPTDFPDLQSAFDSFSGFKLGDTSKVVVMIEAGHQLTSGLVLTKGDYSGVSIQSVDAVVTLDPAFDGVGSTPFTGDLAEEVQDLIDNGVLDPEALAAGVENLFYFSQCRGPRIGTVFDLGHRTYTTGMRLVYDSSVIFQQGAAGLINAGHKSVYCAHSRIVAHECQFTGAKDGAVKITLTSFASMPKSDFSNAELVNGDAKSAVFVSRGSTGHFVGAQINNSGGQGLRAHRAWVSATGIQIREATEEAVVGFLGAHINVGGGEMTDCFGPNVFYAGQSIIFANNCNLASNSAADYIARISGGAMISLHNATYTDEITEGSFRTGDYEGGLNTPSREGIIYTDLFEQSGIGGLLPPLPDDTFANITKSNIFAATSGSTGRPVDAEGFSVMNFEHTNGLRSQIAVSIDDEPGLYFRTRPLSGSFTPWEKVVTDAGTVDQITINAGGPIADAALRFGTNGKTGIHVYSAQEEVAIIADSAISYVQSSGNVVPARTSTLLTRAMSDGRYLRQSHAASEDEIKDLATTSRAEITAGQVGSFAFMRRTGGSPITWGATYAGSALRPAGVAQSGGAADVESDDATVPSGTWRALGGTTDGANTDHCTLFVRVS